MHVHRVQMCKITHISYNIWMSIWTTCNATSKQNKQVQQSIIAVITQHVRDLYPYKKMFL